MIYVVKCPHPTQIGTCDHGVKIANTQHCYCGKYSYGKNNVIVHGCEKEVTK